MSFSIATWNINSVRLRLPLVLRYLEMCQPDILCLQETKCTDDAFPKKAFAAASFPHLAICGQKSYNGVAIVSRHPFKQINIEEFCGRRDCRHISALLEISGRLLRVHNIYVPAGGDEPDPNINEKFAHKLDFIEEMRQLRADEGNGADVLLLGDLNIAPLEHDVWSHKQLLNIVSHTPVETQGLEDMRRYCGFVDLMREKIPAQEKLFTWWSYRARDWLSSNRGRRLDHIWGSPGFVPSLEAIDVMQEARGWEKPSDHVPVAARFNFSKK